MRALHLSVMSLLMIVLGGCEVLNQPVPGTEPSYAPTYPETPEAKQQRYASGGIYSAETALPLFETPRARHPGDIVTVLLLERTNAQKRATIRSRKNDKTQIVNAAFLGRPIALGSGYSMDFDLKNERQFNGEGQAVQNNQLAGDISVTVAKVLANGNMIIQGEKWVKINQGNEYIRLSGIIRPQDIKPDNTITSNKVADARIAYGGTGQVNNATAQGWLSRFIWGPLYPT